MMSRHRTRWKYVPLISLGALAALVAGSSHASLITGRISLSAYTYESRLPDTSLSFTAPGIDHAVGTQSLSLSIGGLQVPGLSLHSYIRNTATFSPAESTASILRVHSLYADYRGTPGGLHWRLGRQFLTAGVATAVMDGIRVTKTRNSRIAFTVFAGLESDQDSLRVSSWSDGGMFGAETHVRFSATSSFSLSGWQLNREGVVAKRRLACDFAAKPRAQTGISGHVEYDFIKPALHRAAAAVETTPSTGLLITAGIDHRQPVFPQGSLFNELEGNPTEEAALGVRYAFGPWVSIRGEAARVFVSGEHADRLSLSAMSDWATFTYRLRRGLTGSAWGIALSADQSLLRTVTAGASVHYDRFERWRERDVQDYTLSAVCRLGVEIVEGLSFGADVESLVNPGYERDVRLLARVDYTF